MTLLNADSKRAAELAALSKAESTYIILMHDGNGLKKITLDAALSGFIYDNAGAHNAIYRGKYLGTSVTADQWAEIHDGTFKDMYIGDYWTINGVNWRIAAFDYWYNCGDTACTDHHIVIVPDTCLYTAQIHNTASGEYTSGDANNPTTGAYVGSDMYTTNLTTAKNTVNAAFGSAHILSHREHLQNAVTSGYESGGTWYDSKVDLMSERMVYGCDIFHNILNGTNMPNNYSLDNGQLPLFRHKKDLIGIRASWWLRGVASSTNFCLVYSYGVAYYTTSSYRFGVRPAFGIYQS